jgi:hypothetical protein
MLINIYSQLSFKERASYIILIIGVIADHISTSIGIKSLNLIESNPITRYLIQNDSWLIIDLLLILCIFYISSHLINSNKGKNFSFLYLYSLISGLVRLYASFLNFSLILSLI